MRRQVCQDWQINEQPQLRCSFLGAMIHVMNAARASQCSRYDRFACFSKTGWLTGTGRHLRRVDKEGSCSDCYHSATVARSTMLRRAAEFISSARLRLSRGAVSSAENLFSGRMSWTMIRNWSGKISHNNENNNRCWNILICWSLRQIWRQLSFGNSL